MKKHVKKAKWDHHQAWTILLLVFVLFFIVGGVGESVGHKAHASWNSKGDLKKESTSDSIPARARALFVQALELNSGEETCPVEILEQKKSLYLKAIEEHPEYLAAWNNLGDVYDKLGMTREAIDAYKKAISIDPLEPMPHFGLGDVYYRLGLYTEAIESYEEGLERAEDVLRHTYLGYLIEQLDLVEEKLSITRECHKAQIEGKPIAASTFVDVFDQLDKEGDAILVRGPDGSKANVPRITLNGNVLPFMEGTSKLTDQAKAQLDELGKAFSDDKLHDAHFKVYAYSDEERSRGFNYFLSWRRANAVARYLVRNWGISPDKLHVVAIGSVKPVIPDAETESERDINRRIEILRLDEYEIAPLDSKDDPDLV